MHLSRRSLSDAPVYHACTMFWRLCVIGAWKFLAWFYTISVELAHAFHFQTRRRNMNGTEVRSCVRSWSVPVKPWQHYPEPVVRIACDGNLYTFTEHCTYYGSHKAAWMRLHSLACDDHFVQLVDDGGHVVE